MGTKSVFPQVIAFITLMMQGFITLMMKGFITLEPTCPSAAAQQRQNGNEIGVSPGHCLHHFDDAGVHHFDDEGVHHFGTDVPLRRRTAAPKWERNRCFPRSLPSSL